jgi:hypothetical protein
LGAKGRTQCAAEGRRPADDIDIVKAAAEDVILTAGARIGEEIAKVPKASGRPKNITAEGKKFKNWPPPSRISRRSPKSCAMKARTRPQLRSCAN